MYDVKSMKQTISQAVEVANREVREEFIEAFKSIYKKSIVPDDFNESWKIKVTRLAKVSDLNEVFAGEGFYIILTDIELANNLCTLTYQNTLKAIYRGECRTVRKRISSHLFNKNYKAKYQERKDRYLSDSKNEGKEFYEPFWPACLKIMNENGLDIDEQFLNNHWVVVIHNMTGSSQAVREQAELAFDEVFGKPHASKEKTQQIIE